MFGWEDLHCCQFFLVSVRGCGALASHCSGFLSWSSAPEHSPDTVEYVDLLIRD